MRHNRRYGSISAALTFFSSKKDIYPKKVVSLHTNQTIAKDK